MERMEMIRYILSSAAGSGAESDVEPVSAGVMVVLWVLSVIGILLLLSWLIRIRGRDPLARCPIRRHCLPLWFVPFGLLIWMVGSFLLLGIIKILFQDEESRSFAMALTIAGMVWYAALVGVFLAVARFAFARGLKGFGLYGPAAGRDLLMGALTLTALLPLIFLSLQVTLAIGRLLAGPDFTLDQHASLSALLDFPQWWMRAALILNAVLIVPLFEEVLFRGLLQSTLTAHLGRPWLSILAVSVFFSLMHPYPTHLPALFVLSVGLGYAYEKSGSLLRPIFIHILFNGLNIILTLLGT